MSPLPSMGPEVHYVDITINHALVYGGLALLVVAGLALTVIVMWVIHGD